MPISNKFLQVLICLTAEAYSSAGANDSQQSKKIDERLGGRIGEVGIVLQDANPTVKLVYAHSPAQLGGLRPGDTIISINGQTARFLSNIDRWKLLRGVVGSPVHLIIERQHDTFTCDITCAGVEYLGNSPPIFKEVTLVKEPKISLPEPDTLDRSMITVMKKNSDTDKVYDELLQAIAMIPKEVKEKFKKAGVQIILTPTMTDALPEQEFATLPWTSTPGLSSLAGGYDPAKRIVYVSSRWTTFTMSITHTLLHECGHANDDLDQISNSRNFQSKLEYDSARHQDLREKFPCDKQAQKLRARELYADFFAVACNRKAIPPKTGEDHWYFDMSKAYPKTFEAAEKTLAPE
jgi:PDZ domain